MTSPRPTARTLMDAPESRLANRLAVLAMLLMIPGVLGSAFGVPSLVQPLSTFAPVGLGEAVLLPLGAIGLLVKVAGQRTQAQRWAAACLLLSLLGIALAFSEHPAAFELLWPRARTASGGRDAGALPVSVGVLCLVYAAALLILLQRRQSERTLILVGGLASLQVAVAGVVFLAQLTGLLEGTGAQRLRASLPGLLATLALGIALLDRLSRREENATALPRWVPMLAGASAALVVLVLWQALGARETSQLQARSKINAGAIDRAVQRQLRTVERAIGRGVAYLRESRTLDDPVWRTGLPRLVDETDGLRHILWFDSSGVLLRSALPDTVPAALLTAASQYVRDQHLRPDTEPAPRSSLLPVGPWALAIWIPVRSPFRGPTMLVGLLDEAALIRPFAEDVARDVQVRVRAGDSTVLQVGDEGDRHARHTTSLRIGARLLSLEVAARADSPRSPLPEVVLVLGLAVSLLLAITLWLQRRIRLQADEQAQRFRAVFDTAFQVQLLLDLDGTVLEANRAAGELAEQTPEQLRGVPFWHAPWWADDVLTAERVQARFERARLGETQRFEVELTTGRDRAVTVDFSLKPLPDATQHVTRVIVEGRDLTIRKRAEESLREISALTTMGRLAARVAHEINNPLAGIQNAFLLVRDAIPANHPHHHFVGAIEREIARIAAVTRQLYETYRPDHLQATESSVILAVSDAVSFLEQVNRQRQVRIVTDTAQAPSLVPVPDALLRQTLYNLVQNAVDVSPPGATITVQATQEGDHCVLRVGDEGPGIPPAIRERIFEPFFSTKDRTMKTGGMGIGLALVRQSVLAIGGQILVHDRPAGGTEFEVRLPMIPLDTGVLR